MKLNRIALGVLMSLSLAVNLAQASLCSSSEAVPVIKAALKAQNVQVPEMLSSLDKKFSELLNVDWRVGRIQQNPRLLQEDLKLADCFRVYLLADSLSEVVANFNRVFDIEIRLIKHDGPLVSTDQNGGFLEDQIVDQLVENKEAVTAVRVLSRAFNPK